MDRRGFLLSGAMGAGACSAVASGGRMVTTLSGEGQPGAERGGTILLAAAAIPPWLEEAVGQLQGRLPLEVLRWVPVGGASLPAPQTVSSREVDVDNREELQRLLSGGEVLVMSLPEANVLPAAMRVEEATRRTYQLLQAAVAAGLKACLFVSTLTMFERYDEDFLVDEDWQPQAFDQEHGLAEYLGEFVCREFAREKLLRVLVLRLGRVVDEVPPPAEARRTAWVLRRDAVGAFQLGLAALASQKREKWRWWTCLHIAGKCPPSRFPSLRAERLLGYRPSDV